MSKNKLIIISSIAFLISVLTIFWLINKNNQKAKTNLIELELPALRSSQLFDYEPVADKLNTINTLSGEDRKLQYEELANNYLTKAEEVSKLSKNRQIYFLKRAISIFPRLENYELLGKLLIENNQFEEANKLYEFLTNKNYKTEKYIFNKIESDWILQKTITYIKSYNAPIYYDLEDLEEAGNKYGWLRDKLLNNDLLKIVPNTDLYHSIYLNYSSEEEKEAYKHSSNFFSTCVKNIKDSSNTFEINSTNVSNFKYNRNYDEDYSTNIEISISPFLSEYNANNDFQKNLSNWFELNTIKKINVTPDVVGIIYSIDTSSTACPKNMRHIYYKLATFSKVGLLIDEKIIAYQSGNELQYVTIENNKINTTTLKRTWKNKYDKNDFDNFIVSEKEVAKNVFIIQSDGKILPEK